MTRSLHIAQVCLPSWGGSSTVAADLALGLSRAGHRATIVSSRLPPRLALPAPGADGVRWHPAGLGDHPALELAGAHTVALAGALVQLAQSDPLDLIHVHYAVPHAAAAALAQQALGPSAPPLIVSLHGTDASALAADPLYRPLMRQILSHCAAVTAPSTYLSDLATAHLGLQPAPRVMANFLDTDHFRPAAQRDRRTLDGLFPAAPDGSPVLLHISNFRPVKRTTALVPLLADLLAQTPCRLLLVGDGPDRAAVEAAVQELGLSDRCTLLAPRADCLDLLQQADAFLLPSESEGFGLAALEAMACGTPVVATAVGGLPEVVEQGHTGLLVPHADLAALSGAVLRLLQDPAEARRMGEAARVAAAERFGVAAGLRRWLDLYAKVT